MSIDPPPAERIVEFYLFFKKSRRTATSLIRHSSFVIRHFLKSNDRCKPARCFFSPIGKKFICPAAGAHLTGFDIIFRYAGIDQLIGTDSPEIKKISGALVGPKRLGNLSFIIDKFRTTPSPLFFDKPKGHRGICGGHKSNYWGRGVR